jgi:hypothetical protein
MIYALIVATCAFLIAGLGVYVAGWIVSGFDVEEGE